MTSLVIAEHDNKTLKDATGKTVTRGRPAGRAGACAGGRARAAMPWPKPPPSSPASRRCWSPTTPQYAKMVAEPMEALILSARRRL